MDAKTGVTITRERARLAARCACDILGLLKVPPVPELHVNLSVIEFQHELVERYGATHPNLVFRTDSTTERARLERRPGWTIPKVILRQGAPPKKGVKP